jgi:hypothetical protein
VGEGEEEEEEKEEEKIVKSPRGDRPKEGKAI